MKNYRERLKTEAGGRKGHHKPAIKAENRRERLLYSNNHNSIRALSDWINFAQLHSSMVRMV